MQILLIMLIVVLLAFSVLLLALAKQSPREKQTEDKEQEEYIRDYAETVRKIHKKRFGCYICSHCTADRISSLYYFWDIDLARGQGNDFLSGKEKGKRRDNL